MMEIEEMKKDKEAMERIILTHLQDFEKVWGLSIQGIGLGHTDALGRPRTGITKVHVDVRV